MSETYAVGLVLEEVAARVQSLASRYRMPLPGGEVDEYGQPVTGPPNVLVGVPEESIAPEDWPAIVINADNGRGGKVKQGDDRRVVLRLACLVYLVAPTDFVWVGRLCDAITVDLLQDERVAGESTTLGGKDNVVRWQSIDEVEMPLAAGQVLCEVRLPVLEDLGD